MPVSAGGAQLLSSETQKLLLERRISPLQKESFPPAYKVLPGQENAESRLEIMVLRCFIVIAEHLRPRSRKPKSKMRQKFRELSFEHRRPEFLIIFFR